MPHHDGNTPRNRNRSKNKLMRRRQNRRRAKKRMTQNRKKRERSMRAAQTNEDAA